MILGLIPSRLRSSRLKSKALLDIAGLPMVIHTYRRALLAKKLDDVYVCTDSEKIGKVCNQYNAKWIMTSKKHINGTERIAEAAKKFPKSNLIVDIQGDEPMINPSHIDKLINFHQSNKKFDIIVPHLIGVKKNKTNVVKVISSGNNVLYLTRADAPFPFHNQSNLKKHLSIISFKPLALQKFAKAKRGDLEKIEGVELLRALEIGQKIGTIKMLGESFSVDILKDYRLAVKIIKKDKIFWKYKN